jgi:hypothetical protein
MYKDKLANAGLYFAQLVDRGKALKQLNSPKLGDSMLKADGTPWLADLAKQAPKLNQDDTDAGGGASRWAAGSRPIRGTTRSTC